jgi:hypothetical protein
MLCRSVHTLLDLSTAVTTTTEGTSFKIRGRHDDTADASQPFHAVFELTAADGTSPTLDATVETSWDGTTWHTVASMTQLAGAGTKKQIVTADVLGLYVRGVVTPGGTANPSVTGTLRLVSGAGFQCEAA